MLLKPYIVQFRVLDKFFGRDAKLRALIDIKGWGLLTVSSPNQPGWALRKLIMLPGFYNCTVEVPLGAEVKVTILNFFGSSQKILVTGNPNLSLGDVKPIACNANAIRLKTKSKISFKLWVPNTPPCFYIKKAIGVRCSVVGNSPSIVRRFGPRVNQVPCVITDVNAKLFNSSISPKINAKYVRLDQGLTQ